MPPSTDRSCARILIVDDQPSNVRLLEFTLRRAGYLDVASTTDPREVAALHLQHRYELILLDLKMPEMDGFEVMEQLRRIGGADRVSILMMSADSSKMTAALEAGASSFLSKPFVLGDVVARVRLMLEAASPQDLEEPAPRACENHRP